MQQRRTVSRATKNIIPLVDCRLLVHGVRADARHHARTCARRIRAADRHCLPVIHSSAHHHLHRACHIVEQHSGSTSDHPFDLAAEGPVCFSRGASQRSQVIMPCPEYVAVVPPPIFVAPPRRR